jgi:hypothetical protein
VGRCGVLVEQEHVEVQHLLLLLLANAQRF